MPLAVGQSAVTMPTCCAQPLAYSKTTASPTWGWYEDEVCRVPSA
ncbi:hypothetical protein [Streptomyces sp. NPDC093089]